MFFLLQPSFFSRSRNGSSNAIQRKNLCSCSSFIYNFHWLNDLFISDGFKSKKFIVYGAAKHRIAKATVSNLNDTV